MFALVAFSTGWGSARGGINSFNKDFLTAFGVAYNSDVQIICVVDEATPEEIADAERAKVQLLPIPYAPRARTLEGEHAVAAVKDLNERGLLTEIEDVIWVGHDRITGFAAVEAAKLHGGRCALIHHMSYDHYESYSEDSVTANGKATAQADLFSQADIKIAIGPTLRDALSDRLGTDDVEMLVPGLAEIEPRQAPRTFTVYLSGRISEETRKIKQGHLGVAAFAKSCRDAALAQMPSGLMQSPKLLVRGLSLEVSNEADDLESELKQLAERHAHGVVNIQALPFSTDRRALYAELSGASVALMPSWHEGFGLVAWEAIAAGVPLIISRNSGVYRLLEDEFLGAGVGCLFPVTVDGSHSPPFFQEKDLDEVSKKITAVAADAGRARQQAAILRSFVSHYTWASCAERFADIVGWSLQKGVASLEFEPIHAVDLNAVAVETRSPLQIPRALWRKGLPAADSQLLRAEEALVPFNEARLPDLKELDDWVADDKHKLSLRLITAPGGYGKTRLAIELCSRRDVEGWSAGFLGEVGSPRQTWNEIKSGNSPTLVVVDYAETRQTQLLQLIQEILRDPSPHPVRVLLLARDAGEWWDALPGRKAECEPFLSSHATSGPYALSPLHRTESDRRNAFNEAITAFAAALGVAVPATIPDLSGEHFGRPLFLQMSALLELRGERPITPQGLTRALLNHERRYWRALLESLPTVGDHEADVLMALATLVAGFATPKDAISVCARVDAIDRAGSASVGKAMQLLASLYPSSRQGLDSIKPDLLGESLVSHVLLGRAADEVLDAVLSGGAKKQQKHAALTVLGRIAWSHPELQETLISGLARNLKSCAPEAIEVAMQVPGDLPALLENAFLRLDAASKSQVAGLASPHLELESLALGGLTCVIREFLLSKAKSKLRNKPQSVDAQREVAICELHYSTSLSVIGRDDEAIGPAQASMERCEKLAASSRDHEVLLAKSLSNYSRCLSELKPNDRRAIDICRRAHEIREKLARKDEKYDSDYAISLSNLGRMLSEDDQLDEALEYSRLARDIRERLASKGQKHQGAYAGALRNHSIALSLAGLDEEALSDNQRSIDIYANLAKEKADVYEALYATALSARSTILGSLGRTAEALSSSSQAMSIRQVLHAKNPMRYQEELAGTTMQRANLLSEIGEYQEAFELATRAHSMHQQLFDRDVERYAQVFAGSMRSYASHAFQVFRDDAHGFISRSAEIYRRLYAIDQVRHVSGYHTTVCDVAIVQWMLGISGFDEALLEVTVPEALTANTRACISAEAAFVRGCLADSEKARRHMFESQNTHWESLLPSERHAYREQWICAQAWLSKGKSDQGESEWLVAWKDRLDSNQNRPPRWIIVTASRLGIELPMTA